MLTYTILQYNQARTEYLTACGLTSEEIAALDEEVASK